MAKDILAKGIEMDEATIGQFAAETDWIKKAQNSIQELEELNFDTADGAEIHQKIHESWVGLSNTVREGHKRAKKAVKKLDDALNLLDGKKKEEGITLKKEFQAFERNIFKEFSRWAGQLRDDVNKLEDMEELIEALKKKGISIEKKKTQIVALARKAEKEFKQMYDWVTGAILTLKKMEDFNKSLQ
ncbi:MAG: hypothetical protein ABIC91_05410 [Nanoarchaeota archaeon]